MIGHKMSGESYLCGGKVKWFNFPWQIFPVHTIPPVLHYRLSHKSLIRTSSRPVRRNRFLLTLYVTYRDAMVKINFLHENKCKDSMNTFIILNPGLGLQQTLTGLLNYFCFHNSLVKKRHDKQVHVSSRRIALCGVEVQRTTDHQQFHNI